MARAKVDNGSFIQDIRERIGESGKSMTRVAVEAGLTPEQLRDILNNRRWLRAVELERIKQATA